MSTKTSRILWLIAVSAFIIPVILNIYGSKTVAWLQLITSMLCFVNVYLTGKRKSEQ